MAGRGETTLALLRESDDRIRDAVTQATTGELAVVYAVDALRLALIAVAETGDPPEAEEPRWMRVELFGHQVVYGQASEAFWAGRRWLEVSWPEVDGEPAGSKRYHPNAVYAMEEIGEEAALKELGRVPF